MAKITWNETNVEAFGAAVAAYQKANPEVDSQKIDHINNLINFGDFDHLLSIAEKHLPDFSWSAPRYSSDSLNREVLDMEALISECFDVAAYDDSKVKGKRLLTTNTKTKKDGTKDAPVALTGTQIKEILLARLHRAAKAEDTK